MSTRALPIGAELRREGGVHFRVWAPIRSRVEVIVEGQVDPIPLEPEGNGYFSGLAKSLGESVRYRYRLDGEGPYPDPASRFQPEGPHGPSQVVDPAKFAWTDKKWKGTGAEGQVLYEMHIGTFTPEGTYEAAARQLPELANLGITCIEMMPVADFSGSFGWGYDGVNMFAPTRLYGEPDDLRRFVDRAHAVGIGVILDVVYNHLGPDGNYLMSFTPDYFSKTYKNEWGEAINFDCGDCQPIREFFRCNAEYWIREFHFDGLRLDATQQIFDSSPKHIVQEIGEAVRIAANGRKTYLVSENEPQHPRLVRPIERGGMGLDSLWNDDYHHSAFVALTGRAEAYYSDYLGSAQEFISAAKYGYLFQGQRYKWQKNRRGAPAFDIPAWGFINFLQNHDQIANSGLGLRCNELSSRNRFKAMTAWTLLSPGTPMLFQGQEFAASSPFFYFADHKPELAKLVAKGRQEFLSQFPSLATREVAEKLRDPADPKTFADCKLNFEERETHSAIYAMHRDLLRLRREVPALKPRFPLRADGAVLGSNAWVMRFFGETPEQDRLVIVNLGRDLHMDPAPEPLLAPPDSHRWINEWASESADYGGIATPPLETDEGWKIPGETTVLLKPEAIKDKRDAQQRASP